MSHFILYGTKEGIILKYYYNASNQLFSRAPNPSYFLNLCVFDFTVAQVNTALQLGPEDFKEKYGGELPHQTDNVVFTCLAGIRSKTALNTAITLGYKEWDMCPWLMSVTVTGFHLVIMFLTRLGHFQSREKLSVLWLNLDFYSYHHETAFIIVEVIAL